MSLTLRPARSEDTPRIQNLMLVSMRRLGEGYYTPDEIESALATICIPDPDLIGDGGFFLVEDGELLVGCGGWSRRRRTHAGPAMAPGDDAILDPAREPARVRAMFTHPDHARRGIGRMILDAAEKGSAAAGYHRMVLTATMSGHPFYRRNGYREVETTTTLLADGREVAVVAMEKDL
ncbi:MAG: GNAT family N-acetyltransferase [Geminicoccaceae bacterium]